jgi:Ca2+-binding RTX toxin-like protein
MPSLFGRASAPFSLVVALLAASLSSATAGAATERVSVASTGDQANGHSYSPTGISADGRRVVFPSDAANLVPGDTNGTWDVFIRDRKSATTERVESGVNPYDPGVSADGRYWAFTDDSFAISVRDRVTGATERIAAPYVSGSEISESDENLSPVMSGDGRYVAFHAHGYSWHVYVHDRRTGETRAIDTDSGVAGCDSEGTHFSKSVRECRVGGTGASISEDGRYIAYSSSQSDLVPEEEQPEEYADSDVFVFDQDTGETERVSVVDGSGREANGNSSGAAISADGRHVAFISDASNLVLGDTNVRTDVFVHDRQTGETRRVSVDSAGGQANGDSFYSLSISADGRHVAFASDATNLVPDDTNGATDVFVHTLDDDSAPPPADCTITGTPGDDVLSGTAGRDVICGLGGDDELSGRSGDDVLRGGEGEDELSGGAGADRLEGEAGADTLSGSLGDDTLSGGAGDDRLYGREGLDTLTGDDGNDTLWGSVGDDRLSGGTGADTLYGGDGVDALRGDDGADSLHGDEGADELGGGAGLDEASYSSRTSRVEVTIGDGANDGGAGEGDDVQADVEDVRGGRAGDRLVGSRRDNLLSGGDGDDELIGAGGRDELSGGNGDDRLDAQLDDDHTVDRLRCGGGLDTALSNPEDLGSSSCELR